MGGYFSSQRENEPKGDTRQTTETGPSCVICGGPFDIEGEVYNIDPKDPQFQWLHHLRLIGSVDDVNHHVVASDGHAPVNTSDELDVFVSGPARFSLTGSGFYHVTGYEGQNDIWVDALSHIPGYGTLFPLHDFCLDTSCRAIEYQQSKQEECDDETALQVLVHLLNIRFTEQQMQDGSLRSVNDLFNLSSQSSAYGPRSVLALTKLEWWGGGYDRFFTSPIEQVDTTAFVQRILEISPRTRDEPRFTEIPARRHQNLERLPKELLDEVCSYLPLPSTIALHRTSKILALQIPLDSTFWRNSLGDGSLHPHIWDLDTKRIEQQLPQSDIVPLDPTASWDWRCAAKILATKRFPVSACDDRLIDVPAGFWNRCRIWATIEEALQQHVFE